MVTTVSSPFAKPTLPLELNALEVTHLIEAVGNGDMQQGMEDPDAKIAIGRRAVVLLAGLMMELVTPTGMKREPVTVQVDEELVWLFRSKVAIGTMAVTGEPIGMALLMKFYPLLLKFHSGMMNFELEPLPLLFPAEYEYARSSADTDPSPITDYNPIPPTGY